MNFKRLLVLLPVFLFLCQGPKNSFPPYPVTERVMVKDTLHGDEIQDPYRWLEDQSSEQVVQWMKDQNQYTRNFLDQTPFWQEVHNEVEELMSVTKIKYYGFQFTSQGVFAYQFNPSQRQETFVLIDEVDHPEKHRVIVDPNQIDSTGKTSIDWAVPSPDGSLLAVSLSEAGTESGNLRVFDVKTGNELKEHRVQRVNGATAGGSLVWAHDGKGFYYTRYPLEGERPREDMDFFQQVFYHSLEQPDEERYELGKDFPKIAAFRLTASSKHPYVLATVQDGDSGRFSLYIRKENGEWDRLSGFDDNIVQGFFGPGKSLFLVSRNKAPRGMVLKLNLKENLSLKEGKIIIEETEHSIMTDFYYSPPMAVTKNRIYLSYQTGGPSRLKSFDLEGNPVEGPKQEENSAVSSITAINDQEILFSISSYIHPTYYYRYSSDENKTVQVAPLSEKSPFDLSEFTVERKTVPSKDGTPIPINIIRKKDMGLNGDNALILNGYGGFGISLSPRFSYARYFWLKRGVIFAVANIRGGGEFGKDWRDQGRLLKKQNCFDDFKACAEYLIKEKYTSQQRLGMIGGSNGGLLMGAVTVQNPDLARAVVSHVGLYDMLRYERSPNGAFNIPEYGSVKNKEQYQALKTYSPYHNIEEKIPYPAMLITTGANDARVDPMHSRKMAARLQHATSSQLPVLFRAEFHGGHGGGTPLPVKIKQITDEYVFFMKFLDIPFK